MWYYPFHQHWKAGGEVGPIIREGEQMEEYYCEECGKLALVRIEWLQSEIILCLCSEHLQEFCEEAEF